MSPLKDVIVALLCALSETRSISLPRLIKLIYLFDWTSVLNFHQPAPRLTWSCGICGPTSEEIISTIEESPAIFHTYQKDNHVGGEKTMVRCTDNYPPPTLSGNEQRALDHVVSATRKMKWDDLVLLISSTMPIVISNFGEPLNILRAATLRNKALGRIGQ